MLNRLFSREPQAPSEQTRQPSLMDRIKSKLGFGRTPSLPVQPNVVRVNHA